MNWKRIGRVITCLLVVCCLIVNMSPIRAEALAVESALGLGLAAVLILATAGVVFNPENQAQIEAIGNSMSTYLYQWGTSAEKLDEVEEFIGSLQIYDWNDEDGDGENDSPNEQKIMLAKGILAGISMWVASVIIGTTEITIDEVPIEGFAYYNGYCLPYDELFNSGYSMIFYSSGVYMAYISTNLPTIGSFGASVNQYYAFRWNTSGAVYYGTWKSGDSWNFEYTESGFSSINSGIPIWTNFDYDATDYDLGTLEGTAPSTVWPRPISSPTYFGDIPTQIEDGSLEYGGIELPESDYSTLFHLGQTAQEAVTSTMNDLTTGNLTYPEFLEITKVDTSTDTETDTGSDPEEESAPDTLANTSLSTFLDALADLLWAPIRWLADTLLNGIKAIFVPSEDFLTEKVEALRERFEWIDPFITMADALSGEISAGEPPVIYVHLGNAEGKYNWGGTVTFLDLSWYSRYKPVGDAVISGFLWAWFVWRMYLKIPGLIAGMPGDYVMDGVHMLGMTDHLPSRKAGYEIQRQSNRQLIRKGRN